MQNFPVALMICCNEMCAMHEFREFVENIESNLATVSCLRVEYNGITYMFITHTDITHKLCGLHLKEYKICENYVPTMREIAYLKSMVRS